MISMLVAAWPTYNDKAGATVRWITPEGEIVDRPPRPDELAELPAAWVEHLRADRPKACSTPAGGDSPEVTKALGEALAGVAVGGSRHAAARDGSMLLTRYVEQERPGAETALGALRSAFLNSVTGDSTRSAKEAEAEWERMVNGAVDKVDATPSNKRNSRARGAQHHDPNGDAQHPDGDGAQHPDGDGAQHATEQEKVKTSVATTLVNLALDRYRLTATADGEPFAVPIDGPLLARPLRGSRGLRAELAAAYFHDTGKAASASALADALAVIEGRALAEEREDASIRVAAHGDNVVIDLGNGWGDAVVIEPCHWKFEAGVSGGSPVLFRRTALTGTLPAPAGNNDADMLPELDRLREVLNVTARDWPVLLGWLVAALLPGIPHPVLLLTGEQGTGKSTAADLLVGLLDPSPAQLRSCPRDLEQWAVAAAGSWVVALDNVSSLTPWLSDALCRAVTGDGTVRRALYTDGDLAVLAFRRVIILTSIDAGSLRGDLAERLVAVELERIDPGQRRSDADLQATYDSSRPWILGGLYDLLSRVLDILPEIKLDTLPRMADFARVLAAVDQVTALGALDNYLATSKNLAASVIDDDPVAIALVALLGRNGGTWQGTSTELLANLDLPDRLRHAPRSPQAITGWLTRITPGLRAAGISVDRDRGNRRRTITITRAEGSRQATSPTSPTSPDPSDLPERGDEGGDEGVTCPPVTLDLVTRTDDDHVTHVTPTSPQQGPLTCDDATGDEGDVGLRLPSPVSRLFGPEQIGANP